MTTAHDDIKKLSFEDAMKQLEDIISQLEDRVVGLEESIDIYEKGERLREHCDNLLQSAEKRVEKIIRNKDGTLKAADITDSISR